MNPRIMQTAEGAKHAPTTPPADASGVAREQGSTLRNLAFLVLEMLPARGAELLDDELLRHRPLVLGRVIVRAAAVSTRHFDDVAHDESPRGRANVRKSRAMSRPRIAVHHGTGPFSRAFGSKAPTEIRERWQSAGGGWGRSPHLDGGAEPLPRPLSPRSRRRGCGSSPCCPGAWRRQRHRGRQREDPRRRGPCDGDRRRSCVPRGEAQEAVNRRRHRRRPRSRHRRHRRSRHRHHRRSRHRRRRPGSRRLHSWRQDDRRRPGARPWGAPG